MEKRGIKKRRRKETPPVRLFFLQKCYDFLSKRRKKNRL